MHTAEHLLNGRFRIFALLAGTGILLSQIVWNRQLLVLVGGSVDACASVLAAFMLGLGTGGRYWGRKAERSGDPLALLRWIAVGAGMFSLLPLATGHAAGLIYPALYRSFVPNGPVRLLVSLIMVYPATFFAGGIIPVLGRLVEGRGGSREVSRLYGWNSLGSAAGGFLAGFILLEMIGCRLTLLAGAALTAGTVLLIPHIRVPAGGSGYTERSLSRIPSSFYLMLYGLSGMFALGYEMVWTRQLAYALGNSTYAFAMMGIMVLAGIGAGSLIGQKISGSVSSPSAAFGYAEICLAVASVLPLTVIRHFGSLVSLISGTGWESRTAASFIVAGLYMLPSTACMGATFPLIVKTAARPSRLGEDIGILSLFNCVGAALGPLIASQFLFRLAGVTKTGAIFAFGSIFIGLLVLIREKKLKAVLTVPAAAALVIYLTATSPPPGSNPPAGCELLFFKEDRIATVSVFGRKWDNYRSLRINGIEEVPIDQASMEAFYLLGHLPWGYNPEAENVMIVAMGGGITAGALLTHPVDELICVELCPAVAEAAVIFREENRLPDLDPRFRLIGDDGRNYLLGTGGIFDLIVCDATHPASADSWVLYTKEFYGTVLSRLAPDGVAAQWVPLHQLPTVDLERILATWARAFPECAVHLAGGRHIILIGSREPLHLSPGSMFGDSAAAAQLVSTGFAAEEPDFMFPVLTTHDLEHLLEDGPVSNTDDRSFCQFMARRVPCDPQATIAPDVALILSLSGEGIKHDLYYGQMAYWRGRLPEAVDILRGASDTAMGRRWLAVALTSAAEGQYDRRQGPEGFPLLEEAVAVDPGWDRHYRLIEEIQKEQEY